MFDVGDEVVTCARSVLGSDKFGIHRHDDACFEARTVLDTVDASTEIMVTDVLSGFFLLQASAFRPASIALLGRKAEFYSRLTKVILRQDVRDPSSAGHVLEQLGLVLDKYLFADEHTELVWRTNDAGDRSARLALDGAARYLVEHRRDNGLGRNRYHILQDVISELNAGPVSDKLVY